jgi:hypothetical protein
MGTLKNQPPRRSHCINYEVLTSYLNEIQQISSTNRLSVADAIAVTHVLEMRRANTLFVNNGQAFDEQIAGIGELLRIISKAVNDTGRLMQNPPKPPQPDLEPPLEPPL